MKISHAGAPIIAAAGIALLLLGPLSLPAAEVEPIPGDIEMFRDCDAAQPVDPMPERALFQGWMVGGLAAVRSVTSLYPNGTVVEEYSIFFEPSETRIGHVDREAILSFIREIIYNRFGRLNCWNFIDPLIFDLPTYFLRSRNASTRYYGMTSEMPLRLQYSVQAWNDLLDRVIWTEPSCEEMVAEHRAIIDKGRICSEDSDCSVEAPATLDCPCPIWVTEEADMERIEALQQMYEARWEECHCDGDICWSVQCGKCPPPGDPACQEGQCASK